MSSQTPPTLPLAKTPDEAKRKDRSHFLYIAVIVAMVAGIAVGLIWKADAVALKPLGEIFIALVKMMIGPIVFCSIVVGIGSLRKAATVGKVGGLALLYFMVMSTFALAIGLIVGNLIHPGSGLHFSEADSAAAEKAVETAGESSTVDFIKGIIPESLLAGLTGGQVLQALFVALIVGFALQAMGAKGEPILEGIGHMQRLVFRLLAMLMWVAPIGAFGAMAALVGAQGFAALGGILNLMISFYITCALFVFVVLGLVLYFVARINVFSLFKYLAREFLLILSTSSSESALPRLIAKMEHLGVQKSTVGITVPTGYSFNLDGTAIYLTMASIFIASAMDMPLDLGAQISLLLFMIVASKGAAGVSGAGLATLAGGLSAHAPQLVSGVAYITGIDRLMSEARALTNFAGNAIATVVIGRFTGTFDRSQATEVLAGRDPFNEKDMLDEH
ncbi:cation:dicarboxylase symporter family transporter [Micrococcales bacterium 31B]|nr:cation:dicarboxylase symporter family transporter [Micrococcales bacterium 31B]